MDGLTPDTILLAVRKMKTLDKIHVYFNSDNSYGVDDCLRLPCGTFIPFIPSNHAYEILAPPQRSGDDPASVVIDLNEGATLGVITTPALRLTVDSGATSTCIPRELYHLINHVTDKKPNIRVRVASGAAHRVIAVGDMTVKDLDGFVFDGKPAPRALSEFTQLSVMPAELVLPQVISPTRERAYLACVTCHRAQGADLAGGSNLPRPQAAAQ